MGIIYLIKNNINGKVYVGQTSTTLGARMSRHYTVAKNDCHATGIDGAIRKYGKENFEVRIVCKCKNFELNEKEIEFIRLYDSYNTKKGYNLTPGGQNSSSSLGLEDEKVIEKYCLLKSIKNVANSFNCSVATISKILHRNNIKIFKPGRVENIKGKWGKNPNTKSIKIIELNKKFECISQCAKWLIENNYCKVKKPKYVSKGICNALKGKRKTYHQFTFSYL